MRFLLCFCFTFSFIIVSQSLPLETTEVNNDTTDIGGIGVAATDLSDIDNTETTISPEIATEIKETTTRVPISTSTTIASTTTKRVTKKTKPTTEKTQWESVGPIRFRCHKGNDEDLSKCFTSIFEDLRPYMPYGVPEIALPPLDPLKLDFFDFHQGSGAVVIKANFTNMLIHGISNFTKASFKLNRNKKRLLMEMDIPAMKIEGTYNLGGNLFFIPIGGTGPYVFQVGDVKVKGRINLHIVNNKKRTNGSKVLAVDNIALNLDIATIKAQLFNLFNGNQVLGPIINNVINENSQDLFKDIRPVIEERVSGIVKIIVNAVLENLTFLTEYF